MNKKLTVGKLLGIIFCVLAAVGTVVLLFVNAYFGGQMKVIDKYYTALERDDFEGYKACFSERLQEEITERWLETSKKEILILQDNENVHAKAEFDRRIWHDALGYEYYDVYYDLTVYSDSESVKITKNNFFLIRENGRWVIR